MKQKEKKLRQYRVEVLEKHQHGKYGKDLYFPLALYGYNKSDAECFAMEVLAGMNWDDIERSCINQNDKPWMNYHRKEEPGGYIGFDRAYQFFTVHAYPDHWLE